MGKAISELDSYTGPMSGTTKLPVSDSDTLKTATASQVKTYIEGAIGTAQFRALLDDATATDQRTTLGLGDAATKSVGTTAGTVAAGDHTHSAYAATGAIGSSGLTMATAKLLGRSTAGTGAPEEITLGTNLSFSGTTLNAAGGGGTPGGSTTQVQYNSSGSFAGDANFTYDGAGTVTAKVWKAQKVNNSPMLHTGTTSSDLALWWQTGNKLALVSGNGGAFLSLTLDTLYANAVAIGTVGLRGANAGFASLDSTSYANWRNLSAGHFYPQKYNSTDYSFDVALGKNASGVAEINSGTAGTFRDLKLRNLIGTGNLATGTVAKTADYTATTSDGTIEVDASGAARTITLFATSGNAGKIIVVKKTDSSANAVTVDGNASETIDGAATISLASQYSTAILQVNAAGTGWNKLGGV